MFDEVGGAVEHARDQTTGWRASTPPTAGRISAWRPDRPVQMRVMDWWRADAGLLVENGVLLDLPHFFLQLDVDLLTGVHEPGCA